MHSAGRRRRFYIGEKNVDELLMWSGPCGMLYLSHIVVTLGIKDKLPFFGALGMLLHCNRFRVVDHEGNWLLHLAFSLPSPVIAKDLISKYILQGVNINTRTSRGLFPIHLASNPAMVALWANNKGVINHRYTYELPAKCQRSVLDLCVLHQNAAIVEAMFKHGAKITVSGDPKSNALELLCATEAVWQSSDGKGLSAERLAVFKKLLQHASFTSTCRDAIYKWKGQRLQADLSKEMPWKSLTEMAFIAAKYTFYAVAAVFVGLTTVGKALADVERKAKGG